MRGGGPTSTSRSTRSLNDATDVANKISTSQIALPEDVCTRVYATAGYEQSVANLAQVSLDGDTVFGEDGGERQLGAVTGGINDGLAVALDVSVSAATQQESIMGAVGDPRGTGRNGSAGAGAPPSGMASQSPRR
ncbi:MAG: hypothetical protein ACR2MA_12105 [Egibacteraceae bacterium]